MGTRSSTVQPQPQPRPTPPLDDVEHSLVKICVDSEEPIVKGMAMAAFAYSYHIRIQNLYGLTNNPPK